MANEHDDDLEPEVDDAAEIETELYPDEEDREAERGAETIDHEEEDDEPASDSL